MKTETSKQQRIDFSSYDREHYIKVVCRTCGKEWLYPKQYEKEFDADHPLENCSYCKNNIMLRLRNL